MCDMTYSYVWHKNAWRDSFMCDIQMCDVTHPYMLNDNYTCDIKQALRMCHDSFKRMKRPMLQRANSREFASCCSIKLHHHVTTCQFRSYIHYTPYTSCCSSTHRVAANSPVLHTSSCSEFTRVAHIELQQIHYTHRVAANSRTLHMLCSSKIHWTHHVAANLLEVQSLTHILLQRIHLCCTNWVATNEFVRLNTSFANDLCGIGSSSEWTYSIYVHTYIRIYIHICI